MTIHVYWELDPAAEPSRAEPTARRNWSMQARDVRTSAIDRYDHYAQIARAAAQTGFDGLFIRHRSGSDDSQIIAATLARGAAQLRLIAEFVPSVGSAVYAAKQAVSFQRLTHNRLGWALASDDDAATRLRGADAVNDDDLDVRADEFLTVARGVHASRSYDFHGRFFEVLKGGFEAPLDRVPFPTIFGQGTSEEALARSAIHADVHLFDAAPLERLRHDIETLDALAANVGRSVGFGVALRLVTREDAAEAVPETGALTGDYDAVAAHLAELAALGITHFVLSASPSFEEAYRIGQFVLPRLRALATPARAAA